MTRTLGRWLNDDCVRASRSSVLNSSRLDDGLSYTATTSSSKTRAAVTVKFVP